MTSLPSTVIFVAPAKSGSHVLITTKQETNQNQAESLQTGKECEYEGLRFIRGSPLPCRVMGIVCSSFGDCVSYHSLNYLLPFHRPPRHLSFHLHTSTCFCRMYVCLYDTLLRSAIYLCRHSEGVGNARSCLLQKLLQMVVIVLGSDCFSTWCLLNEDKQLSTNRNALLKLLFC